MTQQEFTVKGCGLRPTGPRDARWEGFHSGILAFSIPGLNQFSFLHKKDLLDEKCGKCVCAVASQARGTGACMSLDVHQHQHIPHPMLCSSLKNKNNKSQLKGSIVFVLPFPDVTHALPKTTFRFSGCRVCSALHLNGIHLRIL